MVPYADHVESNVEESGGPGPIRRPARATHS